MTTTTINGMRTAAEAEARIRRAEARLEQAIRAQHREHQRELTKVRRAHDAAIHDLSIQRINDMHVLRQEAQERWHIERMRRLDARQRFAEVALVIVLLASILAIPLASTLGSAS